MTSLRRVAVVGRDVPLWLSAAVLTRALAPAGIVVEAIELPSRLTGVEVLSSLPALEAMHHRIGIDEDRLLRAVGGSFSLGHNFLGSNGDKPPFFHAWGSYGVAIDGEPFLGHWLRARSFGLRTALQDFCPSAVAAKNGKLLLPDAATEAFGRAEYAYHLPARSYAGYLKAAAQAAGVGIRQALSILPTHAPDGSISGLRLDNGADVPADLFIDATDADAFLIGGALGAPAEDWLAGSPARYRLLAGAPTLPTIPPYADIRAGETGWTGMFPSASVTGVVHVHAEADEAVALRQAERASGMRLTGARSEPLSHRFRSPWTANCIGIGEATATMDPIHGVDLHVLQIGLVQLLELFPGSTEHAAERAEYNRRIRSHVERIRDFQTVYYATARGPGPFWSGFRRERPPSSLAHRIATFAARGTIAPMEDDSFTPESWQAMLLGHDVLPQSWAPSIDRTSPEQLKNELRRMLGHIAEVVRAAPAHDEYISRIRLGEVA